MRPDISLVIPLLDEEGTLDELHQRIAQVLDEHKQSFEIIFVDDGSRDKSPEIIDALIAKDERVGCIRFRRNFGKAAALDAGFARANGRTIITMDADLQDDPAEIPRMLEKLDEGCDLVSGWKKKRNDPLGKTLPSKVFNKVVSSTSGLKLHDFNCGFKAYRREAVQGVNLYGELHRYVPVLVHWRGFRVTEIPVQHHARTSGKSKYGVERMIKGAFDLLTVLLITRYRTRPLHMFGFVGSVASLLGFGLLAYLTVLWFLGMGPIGTRPIFFLGILLVLLGVQIVSVGLLGEMFASSQAQSGTHYVIKQFDAPKHRNVQLSEVPDKEPSRAEADRAVSG